MTDKNIDPKKRIKELQKTLAHHDRLYFILDDSEISDAEYDLLKQEYLELLQEHSSIEAANIMEADIESSHLNLQKLDRSMLSLSKVLNKEDLVEWLKKQDLKQEDLVKELKLDGLGVEVKYSEGVLVSVLTRGSGFTGEDVTKNINFINENTLPRTINLKGDVNVRGEVYISLDCFAKLSEATDGSYTTPRNAAAGILRSSSNDFDVIGDVLSFGAYHFECEKQSEFKLYTEYMGYMHDLTGIALVPPTDDTVIENDERSTVYPVDGVVLKIDDFAKREELGETRIYPNWAVAYKFPPLKTESVIKSVEFGTGKTGKITPVAFYAPVRIGGVVCYKASIHNTGIFKRLGLRVGSRVVITRNGDVIPQIAGVTDHGDGELLRLPTLCPSCQTTLETVKGADGVEETYCVNRSGCPAQAANRIYVALGKTGLDVKGVGEIAVVSLIEQKDITHFGQTFLLSQDDWVDVLGLKNGVKAFTNIQAAKTAPLNRFVVGMNIPNIGEALARTLATGMETYDDLYQRLQNLEGLLGLPDIGVTTAMEIVEYCKQPEFSEMFDVLKFNTFPTPITSSGNLIDLAISGGVSHTGVSRERIAELLRPSGYRLTNSVTKKTKVLLVGEKPSPSKLEKANRLHVQILELPANIEQKLNSLLSELSNN